MKFLQSQVLLLIIGLTNITAQVSKTNNSPITLNNGPNHVDRTFDFLVGEFGGCTALNEVSLDLQLSIGTGTPCIGGGYGVHEDLNVRLVSPIGTTVDLVQDRWGYWTGNSSQSHSFNGFTVVNATVNFDDDHSTSIQSVDNWAAGNFRPHNPLSAFDGENPVGTWTLRISDGNVQFSINDFYCFVTSTLTVACGAMPVELTNFSAIEREKNVVLSWTTASEDNNKGFEIEHSNDGEVWKKIGFTQGKGSTNLFSNYEFTHHSPKNGYNYYRLKQLDFDGKFDYSSIVNVPFSDDKIISISPNPTNEIIRLNNFSKGKIKIFDASGNQLKELNIKDQEINISDLPNGILFIQIITKTQNTVQRIIKY